jgi:hypothetical protein
VVAPGSIVVHPFVDVKAIQATVTKIFVSDAVNNVVNIYSPAGKQLAQITGFSQPQGLATDLKGNLYVADTSNSQILVFAPPYTKAPKKLADPGFFPAGVAVVTIGKVTTVGVTNICSAPSCGQGGFIMYKNGKASKPIMSTLISRVYFCGFDAKGNLYADGQDSGGAVVVGEIANAATTGKTFKVLTTGNAISFPGGIEVTTKGPDRYRRSECRLDLLLQRAEKRQARQSGCDDCAHRCGRYRNVYIHQRQQRRVHCGCRECRLTRVCIPEGRKSIENHPGNGWPTDRCCCRSVAVAVVLRK